MSIERDQTYGVINSLPDPHASIVENYVLRLEARIEGLERENAELVGSIRKREPWFGAWMPDGVYERLKVEQEVAGQDCMVDHKYGFTWPAK